MYSFVRNFLFGVLCLTCLASCSKQQPADQSNTLENQQEYDFGIVLKGRTVAHTFHICNNSNSAWTIAKVKYNCSCANLELSSENIAHGETLECRLEVDSGHQSGVRIAQAILDIEGAPSPLLLEGRVEVVGELETSPERLGFVQRSKRSGSELTRHFVVTNHSGSRWNGVAVEGAKKWLSIEYKELPSDADNDPQTFSVIASLNPEGLSSYEGTFDGFANFVDLPEKQYEKAVPISFRRIDDVSCTPRELVFAIGGLSSQQNQRLIIKSEVFDINNIDLEVPEGLCVVDQEIVGPDRLAFQLSIVDISKNSSWNGVIKIVTNEGKSIGDVKFDVIAE